MSLLAFLIPKYTSARGRRVTSSIMADWPKSKHIDFLHDLIFGLTEKYQKNGCIISVNCNCNIEILWVAFDLLNPLALILGTNSSCHSSCMLIPLKQMEFFCKWLSFMALVPSSHLMAKLERDPRPWLCRFCSRTQTHCWLTLGYKWRHPLRWEGDQQKGDVTP